MMAKFHSTSRFPSRSAYRFLILLAPLLLFAVLASCGDDSDSGTGSPGTSGGQGNAPGIVEVSAGSRDACARHTDGTVSCWGHVVTEADVPISESPPSSPPVRNLTPTKIGGIANAIEIDAGAGHNCAIESGGGVKCWGRGNFGQLGNGISDTMYLSPTPVAVSGISDARSLDIGFFHSCVLHETGAVSCWGVTELRELEINESEIPEFTNVPVRVPGISDAVAISAGFGHNCAVHSGGEVSCWGNNIFGQLGADNSQIFISSPVRVPGISDAVDVGLGYLHSCALHSTGRVSCWGSGQVGELGPGNLIPNSIQPIQINGVENAQMLSAGITHNCVVLRDGTAGCWGDNSSGLLGDGTTIPRQEISNVSGLSNVASISAGNIVSCALHTDGKVSCWGSNADGQLGTGDLTSDYTPREVAFS